VFSTFSPVTGTFVLEKVARTKLVADLQSISNTMQRKYFTTSLSQETRQVDQCQSFAEPQENADGFRLSSNAVEGPLS